MRAVCTLAIFSLTLTGISGCYNPPDFDAVPKIAYASIDKLPETDQISGKKIDNVVITITFEDGDGDLGATAGELSDDAFKALYGDSGNYELVTVRKNPDGSVTERIYDEDRFKWMPLLKADGKKGPLKGKLDLNFARKYGNSSVLIEEKYKIRIRDRSLHFSNQVETDFITVPGYL